MLLISNHLKKAKPEQVKQIYKLNKIKENLEICLQKRDEIKTYSQTFVMFIDFILYIIKVRHDDIINRICKKAVYKDKSEVENNENSKVENKTPKNNIDNNTSNENDNEKKEPLSGKFTDDIFPPNDNSFLGTNSSNEYLDPTKEETIKKYLKPEQM